MKSIGVNHIATVINFLNVSADYAVLRNYDTLPDNNAHRDIDIIISPQSFRTIQPKLVALIKQSGWRIITYLHSDRLITFVCGWCDDQQTVVVQWDFFLHTSVYGILLMSAEEFLAQKVFNGFLYHVDAEGEFLDKYLYNSVVSRPHPTKYAETKWLVEQSVQVKQKLQQLYRVPSCKVCEQTSKFRLLMNALLYNMQIHPFRQIRYICYFLYTFVRNYIHSSTGFSIGFSGPDGAGKTTVINALIAQLSPVFEKALYYHFRPNLLSNLGDVAQYAGIKREIDRNYDRPHRGTRTGKVSSLLRLLYYTIDYQLGYLLKVKSVTRIVRLVIFDRYYTDIICDGARSRIYLSSKFLYRFGNLFIPVLDYNILLTADADTLLTRKQEIDRESINSINAAVDYLADKKSFIKVTNNSTPNECVKLILSNIFERQHRRVIKDLSKHCLKKKKRIRVYLIAGLGNQLFTYAGFLYLYNSHERKRNVVLNLMDFTVHEYHWGIEIQKILVIEENLISKIDRVERWRKLSTQKRFVRYYIRNLKRAYFWVYRMLGYRMYYVHPMKRPDEIERVIAKHHRILLTMCNAHVSLLECIKDKIQLREYTTLGIQNDSLLTLIQDRISVSVHIRKGDYVEIPCFDIVGLSYYHRAINYFKSKYDHPIFVLFSDEPDWVKKNLPIEGDSILVDWNQGEESYKDMILMTKCNHNIIANSTFSFWGAWLNKHPDKVVIAPRIWIEGTMSSDLIPEEWIQIDNQ
ncbi:MAG: alpha-1,2-fucosyltransferase [Prevotellaceae bacterium]|jgi:thymidylate kinase|nr:alpha-1,2-fucosyltransferase [Prevotellaceae bacterium]